MGENKSNEAPIEFWSDSELKARLTVLNRDIAAAAEDEKVNTRYLDEMRSRREELLNLISSKASKDRPSHETLQ